MSSTIAVHNDTDLQSGGHYVDFDCSHRIISGLIDVLQRAFKRDTQYARPLMQPKANVAFAVDRQAAELMVDYMSQQLVTVGFESNEFRFVRKSAAQGEMLQRVRLEFRDGVTTATIGRIIRATSLLGEGLPADE